MGGRGGGSSIASRAATPSAGMSQAERDILAFYKANRRPGEWMGLADIRDHLNDKGYSREQQDAALMSLRAHEPFVRLVPNANIKAAKQRDIDAGIGSGGPSEKLMFFNIDPAYGFEKRPRP